jgi:hypothetical protein
MNNTMKTKFNPKDVPSWCKWIAVDKNGECNAYSIKPTPRDKPYISEWDFDDWNNHQYITLYKGKPPKNWKDELYTWS